MWGEYGLILKKYKYQHEPLHVPAKWDEDAKKLVMQLERIIDDIYAKISKLKEEKKDED